MLPGAFIGQDSECIVYSSFCDGESDSMFAGQSLIFIHFSPFLSKFIYVILIVDAYRLKIINTITKE